jgi:hypothetical protein
MDYLPTRLADLRDWAVNFAALITADPTVYGLTAGNATTIQTAVDQFTAAYTAATDPTTRTTATVAAMRVERVEMTGVLRQYAMIIRANPSITAALLSGLGLTVPDTERTPIPAPTTFPLLDVVNATPGRHELRFADSLTPASRAKPFGAIGLQLFRAIDATEVPTPDGSELIGQFTTNPLRIDTDPADAGKTATYFARWVTRTGLVGPWSNGTSFTIAA